MEFRFDLVWRPEPVSDAASADLAAGLSTDPVVVINPSLPEDRIFIDRLYRP